MGQRFTIPAIKRLCSWLVLVVAFLLATAVHAQSLRDPVAVDLKQKGDLAIESGQYEVALDAYTRALAVEPSPALHYNRGRALQALDRAAEALNEFEHFSQTASPALREAVPQLEELMDMTRRRVAYLAVTCNVKEAQVKVGERVYSLPLEAQLRLDQGTYVVVVTAPGYTSFKTEITLRGTELRKISATLQMPDRRARLAVASPVSGARVTVDGKVLGTVPTEAAFAAGEHSVTVEHPDYQVAQVQVLLKEGEARRISVALDAKPRFYERWWFWTGVGVVVASGVVVVVALSTDKDASEGDIPPGQITAPLVRF